MMSMNASSVFKFGGSLLAPPLLPDAADRFRHLLQQLGGARPIVLVGGGPMVDAIRRWDAVYGLGEEVSHWTAVRALSIATEIVACLLAGSRVTKTQKECEAAWSAGVVPIHDSFEFLSQIDESRRDPLPRRWCVTSDSIAARLAECFEAPRLVLVKSTTIPAGLDVSGASREGYVDPHFAVAARGIPEIIAVNSTADTATPVRTVIASAARGGILTAGSTT